uniref:Uncharacterized protein n=1 Tax=Acrobeloides nanus TaxID=290746 RepID=A0A914CHD4_9BILA
MGSLLSVLLITKCAYNEDFGLTSNGVYYGCSPYSEIQFYYEAVMLICSLLFCFMCFWRYRYVMKHSSLEKYFKKLKDQSARIMFSLVR